MESGSSRLARKVKGPLAGGDSAGERDFARMMVERQRDG